MNIDSFFHNFSLCLLPYSVVSHAIVVCADLVSMAIETGKTVKIELSSGTDLKGSQTPTGLTLNLH